MLFPPSLLSSTVVSITSLGISRYSIHHNPQWYLQLSMQVYVGRVYLDILHGRHGQSGPHSNVLLVYELVMAQCFLV